MSTTIEMSQTDGPVNASPAPAAATLEATHAESESTTDVDSKGSGAGPVCDTPTELIWNNVEYSVNLGKKKGTKQILKGVSGRAKGGEVLAILGGSGAGKTTLLNSLAGRIPNGNLTGQILLNGEKRERSEWKKQVAYCEQEDLMYESLTVTETLSYAAQLRMPSSKYSKAQKLKRAEEVMVELGLVDCKDVRIGDPQKGGISGGQRKRVSIAIELIANPDILFLDEPTSGLDSFSAFNICESLRDLAKTERKLVICSIHMPRETILDLFDNIILMSQGTIVWFGPADAAVTHFASLGFQCPPNTNPADFFLDIISVDKRTPELELQSTSRFETLSAGWAKVSAGVSVEPSDEVPCKDVIPTRNLPYYGELAVLTSRAFKNTYRDPSVVAASLGQTFVLVLLIGLVFFRLGYSVQDVQSRAGVLFFTVINQTFGAMMPVLQIFVQQRRMIKRERAAGTYRVTAAYVANMLAQLPLTLGSTGMFAALVYYFVNLNNGAAQYFTFILLQCMQALVSMSIGFFIATGAPTLQIAQILGPMINVIFIIFGGSFVNSDTIPKWVGWLQWISTIRYSYGGLIQNEFYGTTFECPTGRPCAFPNGEVVVEFYGLSNPGIWACVAILAGMVAFYQLAAALMLRVTTKPNFILI